MKNIFLFFSLLFAACSTSHDNGVQSLSHIAEFDSTGGRYSELIVSRRVTPDYDIDDFVAIGTARGALFQHCEEQFHTNKAPQKNGLRDKKTLHYLLVLMTQQYLIKRISNTEIERTRFFTKDSTGITRSVFKDTLNNTENKEGERIDVASFIQRRLKHSRHLIYGDVGSEEWFGGRTDNSFETVSSFWDSVLVREPGNISKREAMQREYPVHLLKKYRVLRMRDIADSTARRLVSVDTTTFKKNFGLTLSVADSILLLNKSDARALKVFSFNSNSKGKSGR